MLMHQRLLLNVTLAKETLTDARGRLTRFTKSHLLAKYSVVCRSERVVLLLLLSLEIRVGPLVPQHLACLMPVQQVVIALLLGVDASQFVDQRWLLR